MDIFTAIEGVDIEKVREIRADTCAELADEATAILAIIEQEEIGVPIGIEDLYETHPLRDLDHDALTAIVGWLEGSAAEFREPVQA